MEDKLRRLHERFKNLDEELVRPETIGDQKKFRDLNKERSHLAPIINTYEEYLKAKKELADSSELLKIEEDGEMASMLEDEIIGLKERIEKMKEELILQLLPRDPNDGKDVIMEIRAGTGGEEAALFVSDLFRMYNRYADAKGWKVEFIEGNSTEIGGYKEVIFSVRSEEAHGRLKFESGTHRVQRVPTTESGGRIHTSAVTVAVMPEAEEGEITIDPNEIRVDVYRASGHGGQSVNTTDSAVRITHIPTGMVVTCQDEKSQLKNKTKALRVLRARLYEKEMSERMKKESDIRKSQIGSGDRSERIRTYNFPQSRVTDHRIGLTLHSLESFLAGEIDEVVDALQKHEIELLLKDVNN
ncbi:MAG: peptide chain release factor 1 [Spirochaetae bacterium HGW-Spirochaetae-1]|jgi:peptide chain release factor 1|nr:MAG: peptide chain release factor 1 [Spirochaetae bacterium HGW-Spirochaetae-1]